MNARPQPEPYLTGRELAALMGVSERTVQRMTLAGMPSVVFMKRTRRYLASECLAWAHGQNRRESNVVPFKRMKAK